MMDHGEELLRRFTGDLLKTTLEGVPNGFKNEACRR